MSTLVTNSTRGHFHSSLTKLNNSRLPILSKIYTHTHIHTTLAQKNQNSQIQTNRLNFLLKPSLFTDTFSFFDSSRAQTHREREREKERERERWSRISRSWRSPAKTILYCQSYQTTTLRSLTATTISYARLSKSMDLSLLVLFAPQLVRVFTLSSNLLQPFNLSL